jgi:hypothetical protein
MKHALLNGAPTEVTWAAELTEDAFAEIRAHFSCVDCKARAYLNRGSPHQGAYFASKHHTDDYNEAYQGEIGSDFALVEANAIVIVLGDSRASANELSATKQTSSRRRTTISKGDGATEIPARRRVDAILKELLTNPEFATSSKKIVVEKMKTQASDFFFAFEQLVPKHIDRLIGVWGEAFSFCELNSIAFLNRGDQKINIRMPQSVFSQLKKRYHFTSNEQLNKVNLFLTWTFNFLTKFRVSDIAEIALQRRDI